MDGLDAVSSTSPVEESSTEIGGRRGLCDRPQASIVGAGKGSEQKHTGEDIIAHRGQPRTPTFEKEAKCGQVVVMGCPLDSFPIDIDFRRGSGVADSFEHLERGLEVIVFDGKWVPASRPAQIDLDLSRPEPFSRHRHG